MMSGRAYLELVEALGAEHPLARAERAVEVAREIALDASALLIVSPFLILVGASPAIAVARSAALVTIASWVAVMALVGHRRRRVHDVIVAGPRPASRVVRLEIRRLTEPAHCAKVAAALDSALYQGLHWHTYLPASRPPPGVRNLPPNAPVIRQITACLRTGRASPRAMGLLDRLVQGGYGGAVYQYGPEWARRELGRIRFELLHPPAAIAQDEFDSPERLLARQAV
jgi:hypothetical protein